MSNHRDVTPPIFESDEHFQAWIEGRVDSAELEGLDSSEEEPPVLASDKDYERYIKGN